MNITYCGIDPGYGGGIAFITDGKASVYKMPIIKYKNRRNVRGKIKDVTDTKYDLVGMLDLFKANLNKKSIVYLEEVAAMPLDARSAAFTFGQGFGTIKMGVASATRKEPEYIRPAMWKKHTENLESKDFLEINEKISGNKYETKALKVQLEALSIEYKVIKEKATKNENKKQQKLVKEQLKAQKKALDKLKILKKKQAKVDARALASRLFPDIKEQFTQVNSDGLAEAVLIACYGINTHGLV